MVPDCVLHEAFAKNWRPQATYRHKSLKRKENIKHDI